jgi:hypothetical protein
MAHEAMRIGRHISYATFTSYWQIVMKLPTTVKPVLRGHLWDKENVAL